MDQNTAKLIPEEYKLEMIDLAPDDIVPERFDYVQPKVDGWWVYQEIRNGICQVISSGGEIRATFGIEFPDCDLIAEWIHGTNWAQTSPLKELFVVHDIVHYEGPITPHKDIRYADYSVKRHLLDDLFRDHYRGDGFPLCLIYEEPACNWKTLWKEFVVNQKFEGLIFKSESPTVRPARMKAIASYNYIVMEVYEGNGRLQGMLGGLVGGLFVGGFLTKTCKVGGGFSDSQRAELWSKKESLIGQVFEAHGKILFSSGALRHPNFFRWRDDYPAIKCTLGLEEK